MRALQRVGILDQDARLSGASGGDYQRGRGRQPQRAGAGDDQHRHGIDQRRGKAAAQHPPHGQGEQCDENHHGDEYGGNAVGQSLNVSLGALRLLDQPDDGGELGMRTHRQ